MDKKSVNKARSIYYGFFSKMFVFTPNTDRFNGVLEALDVLIANPLDENSGEALKEVKECMLTFGNEGLSNEFDDIFSNPTTQTLRDTASFYDEVKKYLKTMKTVSVFWLLLCMN